MKRIGILLALCLLLCGCGEPEAPPSAVRVVTGVQVEYQDGGNVLERRYTKSENIEAILIYLRTLRPRGPVIPEEGDGSGCRITLHYSQGPDSVYVQQGNEYLCCNEGEWEAIDSARANLLYPMLMLLPSDE